MEQSAQEEEEQCGICLDALTNPVALPCSHKFCSECLNGWKSKYGMVANSNRGYDKIDRRCPLCREKIPPSKEMITQLRCYQNFKRGMEAKGDIHSENYMLVKSAVERLEHEIGEWTETIAYSDDNIVVLPTVIYRAVGDNDIQKILNWLGPLPVDKQRLNAKSPDVTDFSLVYAAGLGKNSDLLSILLQFGAGVDSVSASGSTPFVQVGLEPGCYTQARLLLEWGAEISNCAIFSKDRFIELVLKRGNSELANLLKSEFGGRRCEIVNLPNRPDLIGKTCVVEKHLPNKDRYKVIFEASKEVGLVGLENLKRRDRTPGDCGYYISYKNGRYTRHDFASKEECQAYVASLTEGDKMGDDAAAESRAEQAAESLLAELSIDSVVDAKSKKGKKKKGKKKKGRK